MRRRWLARSQDSAEDNCVPPMVPAPNFGAFEDLDVVPADVESGEPQALDGDALNMCNQQDEDEPVGKKRKYNVVDTAGTESTGPSSGHSTVAVEATMPAHLVHEAIRLTDNKQFKYPWEKGRLGRFFNGVARLEDRTSCIQPSTSNFVQINLEVGAGSRMQPSMTLQHQVLPDTLYVKAVKSFRGGSYIAERTERRQFAVKQWWEILLIDVQCSDPGRVATSEASADGINVVGQDIVDACFALKSPNTLLKRYYALKTFIGWTIQQDAGCWLPIKENVVWSYLRFLRSSGAAATKASSLLEAIRFGHFVLRLDGASEVLESLRIRGLAAQMFVTKKPWRPASPLSVQEVVHLHRMLQNAECNLVDRVLAGHFLHLIYSRSRWSDLLAVKNVFLDSTQSYLEAEACIHKGAKTGETQSRLLPIVAPARGIFGDNWAKDYLAVREEAGLTLPTTEPEPMLRAPDKSGHADWTGRYLTSGEGSAFLKMALKGVHLTSEERNLTSHSCKATGLSWCSKAGISDYDRSVLARHSSSTQASVAVYSRDLLSSSLRKFDLVINQIRTQTFHPDANRSGMVTPRPVPGTPGLYQPTGNQDVDEQQADAPLGKDDGTVASLFLADEFEEAQLDQVKNEPSSRTEVDFLRTTIEISDDEPDGPDLLRAWDPSDESDEGSESGSSSDSESSDQADAPSVAGSHDTPSEHTDSAPYFINPHSLVLHAKRDATRFRCGRKLGPSYVAVRHLNGLRCGKCFAT